jgi:integrase
MATISRRADTWQAKVRRKGYPTQSATFQTKAAAERWARSIENKVDTGTLSPVESDARRITLREAIDRYLVEFTDKKRGGNRERARLERWKVHELADRVLAAIRPHDMAQARNAMAERGLGPNSIRLELAPISHLFSMARTEWGLTGLPNPVKEISKPSTAGTERDRRLHGDEETRLLNAAESLTWWVRPCIILAIETAMRRGELAALRWDWIDLQRAILRLPMTKNGEARTVPLSPAALDVLRAMPRKLDGRVLGTNPDEISHQFAAARDSAGITDMHFHDMRHEATSRLFECGDLNVMEIATITGHKTLQMLRRYSHPRAADIAAKLAKKQPAKAG